MDIDRTDFSDPALSEDAVATGPHSEVEPAWILPDSPDGKVPVGGTSDLLVALANGGSKMFNVTNIDVTLTSANGHPTLKLGPVVYGQSLGPREQRSFRYPLELDEETPLGEVRAGRRVAHTPPRVSRHRLGTTPPAHAAAPATPL